MSVFSLFLCWHERFIGLARVYSLTTVAFSGEVEARDSCDGQLSLGSESQDHCFRATLAPIFFTSALASGVLGTMA